MARVEMTSHLFNFFPLLRGTVIELPGGSVAELLEAMDKLAPGFTSYILNDRGALRPHVNICINNELIIDRKNLRDRVPDDATLYIFQALTGG